MRRFAQSIAEAPNYVLFPIFFAVVVLTHLTLLQLPYYWDEGGYYIPAALDFYQRWTLIPQFTNAHPPLPNVLLGLLWHLVGYHILATRLFVCAFAAVGLLAVLRLAKTLIGPEAAVAVTLLTAVYPIWFAQSTLAHADIFAAAFTLWAFALYFELPLHDAALGFRRSEPGLPWYRSPEVSIAALFSLAVLSKETAIIQPATLSAIEVYLLLRAQPSSRRAHVLRLAAFAFPVLPLLAWYAYHHTHTGFIFGNPEYLRYNATANFTTTHIWQAIRYRFVHLFWQRNIWLPIAFAAACLVLPRRKGIWQLPVPYFLFPVTCLIAANWLAFSVLGGALLTRYLLPIYPLTLIVCVAVWRSRTHFWPVLAALTAAAFISAIWINPATAFAPEDNLTYRDMIVVHQHAVDYVAQHYANARVLTAWPVAADLFRPELGYSPRQIRVFSVENFSAPEIYKAAQHQDEFDTAIVFTTHYESPALQQYLRTHPNSQRGAEFVKDRDLSPTEIARILNGRIVQQYNQNGEAATILRFDRSYEARLQTFH